MLYNYNCIICIIIQNGTVQKICFQELKIHTKKCVLLLIPKPIEPFTMYSVYNGREVLGFVQHYRTFLEEKGDGI